MALGQVLDTYKPVVWEYARLNITHNVLSKRKLNRLVTDGYVHGWDDPRLLTLAGLRRRGVTPQVGTSWTCSSSRFQPGLSHPLGSQCLEWWLASGFEPYKPRMSNGSRRPHPSHIHSLTRHGHSMLPQIHCVCQQQYSLTCVQSQTVCSTRDVVTDVGWLHAGHQEPVPGDRHHAKRWRNPSAQAGPPHPR